MIETVPNERKLLRKLIKKSKNYPKGKIPISELNVDFTDYYVRQLINKKLIAITSIDNKYNDNTGDYIYDSLFVLEKGIHYFEKRRENFKYFVMKSILTPILVSIITTLIVLAIKLLL